MTGAFRQFGAVLGTAILIAIVGRAGGVAEAMAAADDAYLFGVVAALLSGAVALRLAPASSQWSDDRPSSAGHAVLRSNP